MSPGAGAHIVFSAGDPKFEVTPLGGVTQIPWQADKLPAWDVTLTVIRGRWGGWTGCNQKMRQIRRYSRGLLFFFADCHRHTWFHERRRLWLLSWGWSPNQQSHRRWSRSRFHFSATFSADSAVQLSSVVTVFCHAWCTTTRTSDHTRFLLCFYFLFLNPWDLYYQGYNI